MIFTDADLKNLKEAERPIEITASAEDHCGFYSLFKTGKAEALIERLCAAERVAEALRRYLVNQDHEDLDLVLIAWRQKTGR